MKVVIGVHSSWTDYNQFCKLYEMYSSRFPITEILIDDEQFGIKNYIKQYAKDRGIAVSLYEFDDDYDNAKRINTKMCNQADGLLAFWDYHTALVGDLVSKMKLRKKPILVVNTNDFTIKSYNLKEN